MRGFYARTFLEGMREAKPEMEAALKKDGTLEPMLQEMDRTAPEKEEALFLQLLEKDPLPANPLARIAHAEQLRRQAREITLADVMSPLGGESESPATLTEETTD
jgi:hypothetical protein